MKLRLCRDLHERARACAEAVGDPLAGWIALAVRVRRAGRLDGVAVPPDLLSATRESAVISLPGTDGESPEWLRETIAMAVITCEPLNPPPYTPPLIEGRDYIIGKD